MHSLYGQHPPSFLSLPSPGAALSCGAGTFLVWRPASPLPWFAEQFDTGFKDACVEEAVVETETEEQGSSNSNGLDTERERVSAPSRAVTLLYKHTDSELPMRKLSTTSTRV